MKTIFQKMIKNTLDHKKAVKTEFNVDVFADIDDCPSCHHTIYIKWFLGPCLYHWYYDDLFLNTFCYWVEVLPVALMNQCTVGTFGHLDIGIHWKGTLYHLGESR